MPHSDMFTSANGLRKGNMLDFDCLSRLILRQVTGSLGTLLLIARSDGRLRFSKTAAARGWDPRTDAGADPSGFSI